MSRVGMLLVWALLLMLYALIQLFVLPRDWAFAAIQDAGLYSYITIAIVALVFFLVVRMAGIAEVTEVKRSLYILAYVVLIYALREADFHRLFTAEHITRDKFYLDPAIGLLPKLLGGIPLLLVFSAILYLLFKYSGLLFRAWLNAKGWALAVFVWGAAILTSQILDRTKVFEGFVGSSIEELMELSAASYMLIAAYWAYSDYYRSAD